MTRSVTRAAFRGIASASLAALEAREGAAPLGLVRTMPSGPGVIERQLIAKLATEHLQDRRSRRVQLETKRPPIPAEVEAAVRAAADLPPEESAYVLAAIANRAAAALHKLARSAAEDRKGKPDWGRWARLQNASRDAVLRTATSREIAGELAGQGRAAE